MCVCACLVSHKHAHTDAGGCASWEGRCPPRPYLYSLFSLYMCVCLCVRHVTRNGGVTESSGAWKRGREGGGIHERRSANTLRTRACTCPQPPLHGASGPSLSFRQEDAGAHQRAHTRRTEVRDYGTGVCLEYVALCAPPRVCCCVRVCLEKWAHMNGFHVCAAPRDFQRHIPFPVNDSLSAYLSTEKKEKQSRTSRYATFYRQPSAPLSLSR